MAFDAKSAAAEIVRLVGGKENINSVAHCMTRLRFVVKDLKKADQELSLIHISEPTRP